METFLLDAATQHQIDLWLTGDYDSQTKLEIRELLKSHPQQLSDAFYTTLSFGTGGLRGIMGLGCNRLNDYTIRATTQGLAYYLLQQKNERSRWSVFIGYDSRHHSQAFAIEAAKVLAGNGIYVYLCQELRPTPLVSFSCRLKGCQAAIMITASHNPPQYNGYKIYGADGAQVVSPCDHQIMAEIKKIVDPSQVKQVPSVNHPSIEWVGKEIDEAYIKTALEIQIQSKQNQQQGSLLQLVYTSLHGTGITLLPQTLQAAGFSAIDLVEQQVIIDGNFSTVSSPNPEEQAALEMGIAQLNAIQGDILIATDPDADRIGIAVRHQGQIIRLNGNQFACLILEYILTQRQLPENAAFIKTIGTTELFRAICEGHQKPCFDVLTGFKYIAEKIEEWENSSKEWQFIFGGEESYGCLIGTAVRDKDAITGALMIAEVALDAKLQGKTLIDLLETIYQKYGFYWECLSTVQFEDSKKDKEKIQILMKNLRLVPPSHLNGVAIVKIEDYLTSTQKLTQTVEITALSLPSSDVLLLWLEDGSKIMIRPSGTEPKIKIYCGVKEKSAHALAEKQKIALAKADLLIYELRHYLKLNQEIN